MIANYAVFKKRVRILCDTWDEYYLIPGRSPFVSVREENGRLCRVGTLHVHHTNYGPPGPYTL